MENSQSKAVQDLIRYIIENGTKVLIDTINFHIKGKTDFAKTLSNRMRLRSLASRVKKMKGLSDADAYLLGYMLMVYAQETGNKKALDAFDFFNEHILKNLDTMFREE
ncbi:hypothetical protein [Mesoaciditoga lauensis]|uniref:hypothetical protein n=1 Tax=Mesoaciditoga lauensis TaxID=1495039 RepID=UPI00056D2DE8|nr:hypothetical protein [Mesoaciditoga lauensis]